MAPVTQPIPELEFQRASGNCVTDGLIKLGGGLAVGTVLSLVFFKRRRWPIIGGAFFGIGLAWDNCSKSFNSLLDPNKSKSGQAD